MFYKHTTVMSSPEERDSFLRFSVLAIRPTRDLPNNPLYFRAVFLRLMDMDKGVVVLAG
jgi:hypothetical protein